jgi:modification methylase
MQPFAVAGSPAAPVNLFCADARGLPAFVAPHSAHLVVTSPPYNVGAAYATYDDNLPEAEYLALLADAFAACAGVMVDGARIAVVTPAGVGRSPWRPFSPRIAVLLDRAGFTLRGQIIWDKGVAGSTSWGSFCLPTNPALRDTTEVILVAHKGPAALPVPPDALVTDALGRRRSPWLDKSLFMELAQDHWRVPPEHKSRLGHPAPFPVALVERLIRFYGFPGCHVLDPFAGSGTTGVAAARLGCRATLVEVDAGYCELAAKRIALGAKPGRSPQPHLRAPTRPVCDPAEVSPCAA